ncbi:MAG TPA: sigma-70 family RNA polymerase sigma factor [Methylomirabilota bacterium]|jgi:RNA polymerase sigma-70 factor (ECF subfamily)|nr:sigma-70 family RNA polymerase sigma factor [Methylomirabilota bacterium]
MAETAAEAALVERARGGDGDAFAELYHRFGRRVVGLCRHLLGSADAAEDAASEVFLRVQRSLASYDPGQPFPRWLFSVAAHHCVDVLRRRRRDGRLFAAEDPDATEGPAGEATSPLAEALGRERRVELRQALAALPDRYRVPLTLRYYGELSYEEIASQLGLTRNHVATLIFRAKQELRRTLGVGAEGSRQ